MLKRIRTFFENLVFAGIKPPAPPGAQSAPGSRTRIQLLLDRLVTGTAQSDPLYLSNRTPAQKFKLWLIIGIPSALVIAGLTVVMLGIVDAPTKPPPGELPADQVAEKLLPNLRKPFDIQSDRTLEVVDVQIDRSGRTKVVGTVRNTTSAVVGAAELVFDLTNSDGSRVGAVSTRVQNLPPNASVRFEIPNIPDQSAFALVREIRRL